LGKEWGRGLSEGEVYFKARSFGVRWLLLSLDGRGRGWGLGWGGGGVGGGVGVGWGWDGGWGVGGAGDGVEWGGGGTPTIPCAPWLKLLHIVEGKGIGRVGRM
jgi:hypothetical protein